MGTFKLIILTCIASAIASSGNGASTQKSTFDSNAPIDTTASAAIDNGMSRTASKVITNSSFTSAMSNSRIVTSTQYSTSAESSSKAAVTRSSPNNNESTLEDNTIASPKTNSRDTTMSSSTKEPHFQSRTTLDLTTQACNCSEYKQSSVHTTSSTFTNIKTGSSPAANATSASISSSSTTSTTVVNATSNPITTVSASTATTNTTTTTTPTTSTPATANTNTTPKQTNTTTTIPTTTTTTTTSTTTKTTQTTPTTSPTTTTTTPTTSTPATANTNTTPKQTNTTTTIPTTTTTTTTSTTTKTTQTTPTTSPTTTTTTPTTSAPATANTNTTPNTTTTTTTTTTPSTTKATSTTSTAATSPTTTANTTTAATSDTSTASRKKREALNQYCYNLCMNQSQTTQIASASFTTMTTAVKTTVLTTVTTTKQYPDKTPQWGRASLKLPAQMEIKGNFSNELTDNTSTEYKNYSQAFHSALYRQYNSTPGFQNVTITGFRSGSIIASYDVTLRIVDRRHAKDIISYIYDESKIPPTIQLNGKNITVEKNKTFDLLKDLKKNTLPVPDCLCSVLSEVCSTGFGCDCSKTNETICIHICHVSNPCGYNGDCFADSDGNQKCRCHDTDKFLYHGDHCRERQEKLALSSTYIIVIATASAGVVVLAILFVLIWICAKWRKSAKNLKRVDDTFTPEQLKRENSVLEDVPLGGMHVNKGFNDVDQSDDYRRDSHHVDTDETERQMEQYDDGAYYRVLERPDIGEGVKVYQPSRLISPSGQKGLASQYIRNSEEIKHMNDTFQSDPSFTGERDNWPDFYKSESEENAYMIKRPQVMRR